MIKFSKSPATFYRICIEGNIGCGKTSILKRLAKEYGYFDYDEEVWRPRSDDLENVDLVISPEPLNQWISVPPPASSSTSVNLLKRMYSNPKRWGFTFEHYSQFTRYNQIKSVYNEHCEKATNDQNLKTMHILERSIFSNRFCFVENFYKSGEIEQFEYQILDEWFRQLISKPESLVNKFIYLQTAPQTVYDRILNRARTEEEAIPLEYLLKIHNYHERLFNNFELNNWSNLHRPFPKVVLIDGNQPLEEVYRQVEKHIFSTII
ncbi:hypothetical protein RDWZM_006472 [Blomia tropicalis]|uniref:Deoxynucleoside kinase domain-containing protein n=1 Tax=Blomia tropicalis TaxID=40697 RepID=A0A9Q0RNL4_BLOTA|nr:hypothetical protein RDWZM_006472 [Blomia tropicalis]